MGRHVGDRFVELEIVRELGAFGFLALHQAGGTSLPPLHTFSRIAPTTARRLRHALDQDVARAFKGGVAYRQRPCRWRCTSALPRPDRGAGLAKRRSASGSRPASCAMDALVRRLRTVGGVEVFQLDLGLRRADLLFQLRRQLALFLDGTQHDFAAVIQDGEVFEPLGQRAQLRVVEPAGALLAVARDEGDGCAFFDRAGSRRRPGLPRPRAPLR